MSKKRTTHAPRSVGLAALMLLTMSACRVDAGPTRTSNRLPERGLFPTSPAHFERIVRSERLPTVVNVWASWCVPCRREAPLLRKAAERYEGRIRFLGLDTQDTRAEALEFIRKFRIPYPNGFDPKGDVARHLKTLGVPATFFYQPGGELSFVHNGEIHSDDLRSKIESLLTPSANAPPPRSRDARKGTN